MTERDYEIAFREKWGYPTFSEWRRTDGAGMTDTKAFHTYNDLVRGWAVASGLVD